MAANSPKPPNQTDNQEIGSQASKQTENGPETNSRPLSDTTTRHQLPTGHVEKILEKFKSPQSNGGEGPSGTPRWQKILELYTAFQKLKRRRGPGNDTEAVKTGESQEGEKEPEKEAPERGKDYADQLRDLTRRPSPDSSTDKIWAFNKICTIIDINIEKLTGKMKFERFSRYFVDELLNGEKDREVFDEKVPNSVRWIHLPANNMAWLEALMKRYYEGKAATTAPGEINDDATTMQEQILYRGWWDKKQRSNRRGVEHSRFMEPLCKKIVIDPNTCKNKMMAKGDNMVLFMPFLHWETNEACVEMELVIQDTRNYFDKDAPRETLASGTCLRPKEISDLPCSSDERPVRLYLLQNSPLHVRRTLDQSFYYTLADTSRRDGDQVVYRYMRDQKMAIPAVLMVDQCWLWVLNGNTVVTCFPQLWNTQKHFQSIDATKNTNITYDKTDILQNIIDSLKGDREQKVQTAWSLAEFIVDYCSRNVFDIENMPDEEHQFLEFFSRSISNVMDKQVQLSEAFIEASKRMKILNEEDQQLHEKYQERIPLKEKKSLQMRQGKELDALFDVTQEVENLKEIKDIMEELQIITHINECQEGVLIKLRNILMQLTKTWEPFDATDNRAASKAQQEQESQSPVAFLNAEEESDVQRSQASNDALMADKGKSIKKEDEQEGNFQALPADLAAAEEMILQSKARKEIINGLYNNAHRAYSAIRDLLELKQKQANISEARSARQSAEEATFQAEEAAKQAEETTKQGYSIMLFTIVTILFLPLSTLASLFALNVPGLSDGSFKLGVVYAILFPISVVVVTISFILAFHQGTRRLVLVILRIFYGYFPRVKILDPKWIDEFENKHVKHQSSSQEGEEASSDSETDGKQGKKQQTSGSKTDTRQENKQHTGPDTPVKEPQPAADEPKSAKSLGVLGKLREGFHRFIGGKHPSTSKEDLETASTPS